MVYRNLWNIDLLWTTYGTLPKTIEQLKMWWHFFVRMMILVAVFKSFGVYSMNWCLYRTVRHFKKTDKRSEVRIIGSYQPSPILMSNSVYRS